MLKEDVYGKEWRNVIFRWTEAYQAGVKVAEGKGWNLGRPELYGFDVLVGGVLAVGAYHDFMVAK